MEGINKKTQSVDKTWIATEESARCIRYTLSELRLEEEGKSFLIAGWHEFLNILNIILI